MNRAYIRLLTMGLCCGLLSTAALAQTDVSPDLLTRSREFDKVGATSGTFLTLPVGARATAMGSGFVAVSDDPSALYWNPAGINQVAGVSASYSYTSMFAGLGHNFAGVTIPISDAYKVGISAITFGSGDIPVTTLFKQDGTGETYSISDLAFGVTLSGQLTEQFSFGATGKYVSLSMASLNAGTVAFDVGTLYKPGILGMRIGFAVQNLSGDVKYTGSGLVQSNSVDDQTGNQNPDVQLEANSATLPLTFRGGLASNVLEGDEQNQLLVNAEFSTSSAKNENLSVGAEYVWDHLVAVRAGYLFGSSDSYGISGGLGLTYDTGDFSGAIDYAVRPHKNLGLTHMFSASIRLQ